MAESSPTAREILPPKERPLGRHQCGYYGHHRKDGQLCRQPVTRGTETCKNHSGKSLVAAKAEGEARLLLARLGAPDIPKTETAAVMLQLQDAAVRQLDLCRQLLTASIERKGVARAFTREIYGEGGVVGEIITGEEQLHQYWFSMVLNVCRIILQTGINDRKARAMEDQGRQIAQVIRLVMGRLGMTDEQERQLGTVLREILPAA